MSSCNDRPYSGLPCILVNITSLFLQNWQPLSVLLSQCISKCCCLKVVCNIPSSRSAVSTALPGRWTYLTTLPLMKTFLTEDCTFSSADACLRLPLRFRTDQMRVLYFLNDSDILEFDILQQLARWPFDLELWTYQVLINTLQGAPNLDVILELHGNLMINQSFKETEEKHLGDLESRMSVSMCGQFVVVVGWRLCAWGLKYVSLEFLARLLQHFAAIQQRIVRTRTRYANIRGMTMSSEDSLVLWIVGILETPRMVLCRGTWHMRIWYILRLQSRISRIHKTTIWRQGLDKDLNVGITIAAQVALFTDTETLSGWSCLCN